MSGVAATDSRELVVVLDSDDGEVEVGWNLGAVAMLGGSAPVEEALWRVDPAPRPGSTLRILSSRLSDERLLLVAAVRSTRARSHADEILAGAVLDGERMCGLDEILLSTEYDAAGRTRRISLEAELTKGTTEDGEPVVSGFRCAGERREEGMITDEDAVERIAVDLSTAGVAGVALLETIAPPA